MLMSMGLELKYSTAAAGPGGISIQVIGTIYVKGQ
jgi:hypothetical protein